MDNTLVSVIVPIRNSSHIIGDLLDSLLVQTYSPVEVIINDDVKSADNTEALIREYRNKGLNVQYFRENYSMAQGRKAGFEHTSGDIILHIDSDMRLTSTVIADCVERIKEGCDAVIIPEESFGEGFWAKCKVIEKRCYQGIDKIESARCMSAAAYRAVGGHDPELIFSEDKDLDLRLRAAGYSLCRVQSFIMHNEGKLQLQAALRKKLGYSNTANAFRTRHPDAYRWQANPFIRYWLFLRRIDLFFSHPLAYIGMFYMKTCEYAASAFGILRKQFGK